MLVGFSSLHDAFAAAMDRLGPFESNPLLGAAVSGGADSMALAVLAQRWTQRRQGTLLALVVDHGLRPEAAGEARITIDRLGRLGVPAVLLPLTTLHRGPALAERARIARYQTLSAACQSHGSLHLLLGHHLMDQAETMMMRVLQRSMTHGMAAMPALWETRVVRVLRPLLAVHPEALRRLLRGHRVEWVEDPSNHDPQALRPRLRQRASAHLSPDRLAHLNRAARAAGTRRACDEAAIAAELAERVTIRPEGFALLSPGRISTGALASLIRVIGGARYTARPSQINALAARPRPATLAGVRLLPAGRMGKGLLLVREEEAAESPVSANPDSLWDRRFRLIAQSVPAGTAIGKLAADAKRFRGRSSLPAVVLRTLPALRHGKTLAAVPHLRYAVDETWAEKTFLFEPPKPLAGSCFLPPDEYE